LQLRGRVSKKKWEDAKELWLIAISTEWKWQSVHQLNCFVVAIWEMSFEVWDHQKAAM
jgi:hypothetical protein